MLLKIKTVSETSVTNNRAPFLEGGDTDNSNIFVEGTRDCSKGLIELRLISATFFNCGWILKSGTDFRLFHAACSALNNLSCHKALTS